MDDISLAHSRYNCTYHIVFIPKYRRKAMFGALRREVGEILGKVCSNDAGSCTYVYVSIPPKACVSKVKCAIR